MNKLLKSQNIWRVFVVLICLVLISSAYFSNIAARFTSAQIYEPGAGVAAIDFTVDYKFSGYGDLGDIDGDSGNVYVVVEEFTATNTGEVNYEYVLSLRISRDVAGADYNNPDETNERITLGAPKNLTNVIEVYHPSQDSTDGEVRNTTASALTGKGSFTDGKAYYAVSTDGTNYTWYEANMTGSTLTCNAQELNVSEVVYYKIIYFIEAVGGTTFEQMALYYSVTCEQII